MEAEALGLPRRFPQIGPEVVKGIEINPYAAELARVSVWIGEIQWMLKNGFAAGANPVLKPLDTIECRDAVLVRTADGRTAEAKWPKVDAIIGNPPFLGGKIIRSELGDDTVERLFAAYRNRVPAEADLVVYWVAKGLAALEAKEADRVGFVTTNSVRGGANRRVLDQIADGLGFICAWDDEPWTVEGAAVRVSMIVFGALRVGETPRLDGAPVSRINADLTASEIDLTKASRLPQNAGVAFMGDTKGGAFDISGDQAREWLQLPVNPNGRPNADVLRPWVNGMDVTRRSRDMWIIDFGWKMDEAAASLYDAPYSHALEHVKPVRAKNKRELYRKFWWRHAEPRQGMWRQLQKLTRFVATPRVGTHRLFKWRPISTVPDSQVITLARDDETSFGVLHSRFHELWSLRLGTWLGKGNDPRYTPTTTFETYPFPEGLTPDIPATHYADDPRAIAIATAAARLNELRENWLNPSDLVRREPEVVPGFPDRILPVDEKAAAILKKRTLTNLYNERPAWLDNAHKALDAAVAAAYGWPADLSDDEILARLFALNQERAAAQTAG